MAFLQPWKHIRCITHLPNGFKLTSKSHVMAATSVRITNRHSSSLSSIDDIPDFGYYSVILPPEPYVFGVSHIKPRPVPSHIHRPSYVEGSTGNGGPSMSETRGGGRITLGGESEVRIREAAKLAKKVREYAGSLVQVGVTTNTIDAAIHDFIIAHGAYPSPLLYSGFPRSCCTR
ncbi:hypothetical protein AX15_006525 [Amanita polypyramis BW_CC]|nr:hypothetical protein AX15_006525 [Amanita polypyramis BW_CC]